jgi:hypothetical protein
MLKLYRQRKYEKILNSSVRIINDEYQYLKLINFISLLMEYLRYLFFGFVNFWLMNALVIVINLKRERESGYIREMH